MSRLPTFPPNADDWKREHLYSFLELFKLPSNVDLGGKKPGIWLLSLSDAALGPFVEDRAEIRAIRAAIEDVRQKTCFELEQKYQKLLEDSPEPPTLRVCKSCRTPGHSAKQAFCPHSEHTIGFISLKNESKGGNTRVVSSSLSNSQTQRNTKGKGKEAVKKTAVMSSSDTTTQPSTSSVMEQGAEGAFVMEDSGISSYGRRRKPSARLLESRMELHEGENAQQPKRRKQFHGPSVSGTGSGSGSGTMSSAAVRTGGAASSGSAGSGTTRTQSATSSTRGSGSGGETTSGSANGAAPVPPQHGQPLRVGAGVHLVHSNGDVDFVALNLREGGMQPAMALITSASVRAAIILVDKAGRNHDFTGGYGALKDVTGFIRRNHGANEGITDIDGEFLIRVLCSGGPHYSLFESYELWERRSRNRAAAQGPCPHCHMTPCAVLQPNLGGAYGPFKVSRRHYNVQNKDLRHVAYRYVKHGTGPRSPVRLCVAFAVYCLNLGGDVVGFKPRRGAG